MTNTPTRRFRAGAAAVAAMALAIGGGVLSATPAGATSASAAITAGSLAFVSTPASVGFSATLNGTDQTSTSTATFDVGDATGSGTGWNITATSTTFSTGTGGNVKLLSTSASTVQTAPTVACDTSVTCTTASNTITFPFVVPAGSNAPTAQKLYNAASNSGMGNQTVSASFRLTIPANTYAGTYSSTWTYSLVSAP